MNFQQKIKYEEDFGKDGRKLDIEKGRNVECMVSI